MPLGKNPADAEASVSGRFDFGGLKLGILLEPETFIQKKRLFQLDVSPNLYMENGWKKPHINLKLIVWSSRFLAEFSQINVS